MPIPRDKSIEIYLLHEIDQMGGSVRRSDDEIYQRVAAHFPLMSASDLELTDAAGHTAKFRKYVEFTDGAKETASEQGRQVVHLIDGKELIRSMVDKRIGVKEGPMGVPDTDEDFWGQF